MLFLAYMIVFVVFNWLLGPNVYCRRREGVEGLLECLGGHTAQRKYNCGALSVRVTKVVQKIRVQHDVMIEEERKLRPVYLKYRIIAN